LNPKAYLSRIIHRAAPFIELRGSLSNDPTARVLHALLAILAMWLAVGWIATIPFARTSFPRYFNPLVQETSYVTALVLLRRGHFRRASLAYLTGTWIFATLICFSAGFKTGGGALLYVSLPASAAWLLGYGAAIRTAGACLLSALVFAILEMTHVTVPFQSTTPLGIWFVIVQAVAINAIPLGQIIARLRETLKEQAADLIERKRMDEVLRESEERFRRVFEEGPLGLALVAKDYRFVKVNRALCQMVGYSETELSKKSFVDITYPDDVRNNIELSERLFRGETPFYRLRKRYVKRNGDIIWINLTASVIRDQEGEVMYGLAMIEDITEAKQTQEESLARQKLESVGVLAGGIAHDFNNLLGGILAQTESIEQDLPESSSHIEELHHIKEAAMRGSEIVRELMIYSGQDKTEVEPVDMARLVEEMLALLKVSVSKRTVLKTDLPTDLAAVRGSAPQLRQLLMNLVINASEAIGETDGVIRVTLSSVAPCQDLASNGAANWRQSGYLRLEVSDTGSGMTEETQSRIFDPFFTTKFAGRGLGLAVVQSIVNGHGGTIHVVSTPRRGTTFQIDLPSSGEPSNPDGSAAVATSDERISGTARTVLLVEDEDLLRHAVAKMLRMHGFSVIEASDGSAALDLVRNHGSSIEVMLLDLSIPGAPSSEVVVEARRVRPGAIVILMSAYSQAMVPPSLNVPEVKGFIRKPFQMSDLVQLLRGNTSAGRN
jgi:two-component system, cell cycle sensor histidine kinase and response regulator CckA